MAGNYTVVVDGKKYSVQVAEGDADIQVTESAAPTAAAAPAADTPAAAGSAGSVEVLAQTPGNVWKVVKNVGDTIAEGEVIMILEAMKMEIDIPSPQAGTIASINVNTNDAVQDGQILATIS